MMFLSPALIVVLSISQYLAIATEYVQWPVEDHGTSIDHKPILNDEFAAWLAEIGYNWGMKGVAIAVTRKNHNDGGWTTETKGYGVADRWGNPVDEETLFAIGSNSKLFTALGIGLLTANESIPVDWDTKIKDILPKSLWVLRDPIAQEHADLVDILTHRTGLPRHDMSYSLDDTSETVVAKLRYLRPSAEFRDLWQYNNQMYITAAHIISRLTEMPDASYITRNIISPLSMNFTTYNITEAEIYGRVAEGFLNTGTDEERGEGSQKLRFKPIPFWNKKIITGMLDGAGGVISNAKDMAKWLQALLLLGKSPETGDQVIPASVVERVAKGVTVYEPQAREPELSPSVYGMGQYRYTYQGHELIEHSGATIGHYSVVTRAPHDGLGIAILSNSDSVGPILDMIKFRLLEKSLGLPKVDWEERFRKRQHEAQSGNSTRGVSDGTSSGLPYDALVGIYFNPAYGTITLCPYPPSSNKPSRKECEGVVSESLLPKLNESPPALLAAWSKVWSTHVLLHHLSGNRFRATLALTFPAPFPDLPESDDDSHPFAVLVGETAPQFAFAKRPGAATEYVEGFAITGAWGAAPGAQKLQGEGRDGAEVWFDRVA